MAKRVNLSLSDGAIAELEKLPEGERSRHVSELIEDAAAPRSLRSLLRQALRIVRMENGGKQEKTPNG